MTTVQRLNRLGTALLVFAAMGRPALAIEQFCKVERYFLGTGQVHEGDLYTAATSITVSGHHQGDLIAFATAAVINGEVDGDVMIFGQSVDISGTVHDTVRTWSQALTITGTIDGDVLFLASHVTIHPNARIKGRLIGIGGTAIVDGVIERGIKLTVGQANINGTVLGDAVIQADAIELGEAADISGDLLYTARKELDIPHKEAVQGEIVFTKKEKEKDDDDKLFSVGSVLWFAWKCIAAMLVGFVLLALAGRRLPELMRPIRDEPMLGTLIGFGSFLVVPAACLLAIVLIISAPLGLMALLVFGVTLYLAKLPVALWVGQRLLSLVGLRDASPYLALAIGLVLLNLIFALPFWIGFLALLVTTWLGLGTILLALRGRFAANGSGGGGGLTAPA